MEYIGYALAAIASAVLGAVYKRYHRDRRRLSQLEAQIGDGKVALTRINAVERRITELTGQVEIVVERQGDMEETQNAMLVSLGKIETNVDWIKRDMEHRRGYSE